MKNTLLIGGIVVLLIAAFFIFQISRQPGEENETLLAYANSELGFSFEHSAEYVPVESEGLPVELAVALYHKNDWEGFKNSTEPREGPTGITVEIFENESGASALQWVTTTERSNFNLGSKEYSELLVAGEPTIVYRWSGLYEGQSAVFVSDERVYMISVTYLTPDDQSIHEFERVLSSFTIGA